MTNKAAPPAEKSKPQNWGGVGGLVRRQYARTRTAIDLASYKWKVFSFRHGRVLGLVTLALLIALSGVLLATWLAGDGKSYTYKIAETVAIYLAGGAGLLGATAIVSSIVLFSVQINIERTPYGLFRKLSSDALLLSLFGYSFGVSGAIVIASAFLTQENAPWMNFLCSWGVLSTLCALSWSYRRALKLISPIQQINMVLRRIGRSCRAWDRAAERTRPVIEHLVELPSGPDTEFDGIKRAYWDRHPHWVDELKEALHNFNALTQTYAINGDHQVAGAAVLAIPQLLKAYAHTRRGTFRGENPIFPTGNGTDGFINEVLETLRKQFEAALKRGDEAHVDHCTTAMGQCAQVLAQIDYRSPVATKMHASIATNYLMTAMESIIKEKMPDAAMHAIREAGIVAARLINTSARLEVLGVVEKLALKAILPGFVVKELLPVSIEAVAKITDASALLMAAPHNAVDHASKRIHELICWAAAVGLQREEVWMERTHSFPFEAYFGHGTNGLLPRLIGAANAACAKPADNVETKNFIRNFEDWLDGAQRQYHELYKACAARGSTLGLDLVSWMAAISDVASALATAPACPDYLKDKLTTLSRRFLPGLAVCVFDAPALANTSLHRVSTSIAELGIKAARRDQKELAEEILDVLIGWAAKHLAAGSHHPDQPSENIARIAALTVAIDDPFAEAKAMAGIEKMVRGILTDTTTVRSIESDAREGAMRPDDSFMITDIELRNVDSEKFSALLSKIADLVASLLSPNDGNQQ